jgi:hypothetical protein
MSEKIVAGLSEEAIGILSIFFGLPTLFAVLIVLGSWAQPPSQMEICINAGYEYIEGNCGKDLTND